MNKSINTEEPSPFTKHLMNCWMAGLTFEQTRDLIADKGFTVTDEDLKFLLNKLEDIYQQEHNAIPAEPSTLTLH